MRTRRRRYRPVSRRRREEQQRIIRRRAMIVAGVLLLASMAMAPQLRESIASAVQRAYGTVQTMASGKAQAQIILEEKKVYALQLGAYDNGEHAQRELSRLIGEGVLPVIWQREQMRLVCDASESKRTLSLDAAKENDVWTIQDTLPEVALRVSADAQALSAARDLLTLPDRAFEQLCTEPEKIRENLALIREEASRAQGAHPDNALYTQLAQSIVNWCNLMDSTQKTHGDQAAASYGRVTMYTLCYELRRELMTQSAASTASAQRTPSTAADVMPPA